MTSRRSDVPLAGPVDPRLRLARRLVIAIILFTALYSLALASYFTMVNAGRHAETDSAALNLLRLGYIGNPYVAVTGPTAHVPPGLIVIMALAYGVFGTEDPLALVALGVVAAMMFVIGQVLVLRILDLRRVPWPCYLVLAAVFTAAAPDIFECTVSYRNWDQPYSATILIGAWWLLERSRIRSVMYRDIVGLACLTAVGSLFSAAILPSMAVALAIMVWSLARPRRRTVGAALALCVVVAGMLPWAIRNELVMGRFIVTRSNFPLEFALGNMPGANGGLTGPMDEFVKEHHPFFSPAAAREMAAIGEPRFMDGIATISYGYVRAHPSEFIRLTIRRIRYLLLPWTGMRGWHPGLPAWLAFALGSVVFVLRPLSLLALTWLDRRLLFDGLTFTILPLLPYALTHVEFRYIYVVDFTSMALVVLTAGLLLGRFGVMRSSP